MIYLWICIFAIAKCIVSQDAPERFLTRYAVLDKDGLFSIQWGVGEQEDIVFKIEARTLGYVAIGFSNHESLFNTDVVVGWVANSSVYLQDRYAEGNRMPDLDDRQDWELISGYENATHTCLIIRRKLDTCDIQDYALEYKSTVRVMHAYSFDDPIDEFTVPFNDPSKRGWRSFLLLQPESPVETEVEFWDVLTSDFAVSPEWETMYWCKLIKGPSITQKHHITTVDTVLLGGTQGHYVHHVLLLECFGATSEEFEPYLAIDGYDCYDPNIPLIYKRCDGIFVAWGIGGGSLVLPEHIGMPLEPNSQKYYMLQVHYDNLERHAGTPGRAGFRLHHTPKLRQYDAGFFIIGVKNAPNIIVPPRVRDFVIVGHNNPDCLSPAIPEEGVLVSKVGLHTHLLGTVIKLRHFRGNKELPPIAFDEHYDPHFQKFHILEKEVILMPRDQVTIECLYDSFNKSTITFGGLSTREEMCNAFLIHYPKVAGRYGSLSEVPKQIATKAIGSQDLISLTASEENYDRKFVLFMWSYDWKKTAIRRYEKIMKMARHRTFCYLGIGDNTTVTSLVSYPADLQEYKKPKTCKGMQSLRRRN